VRRTIAVLTNYLDHLGGGYEAELRRGYERAAAAHDVNLLLVVGRSIGETPHDKIYDLIRKTSADALVLLTLGLERRKGLAAVETVARATGLPFCSLGERIPGVPSILIDNRSGLNETIDHLIFDHGRRRILFLSGPKDNSDARARLEVYREALKRHDITDDPSLVAFGDFTIGAGVVMMKQSLPRGADFDAVVSANDGMALGAMEVLRERHMAVPELLSVTGFDDLVLARFVDPPLTTIRQPIEHMGALAVELMLARLDGAEVPELTELPVEVVRRRSCGCAPPRAARVRTEAVKAQHELARIVAEQSSDLAARIATVFRLPPPSDRLASDALLEGLRSELGGGKGAFNAALKLVMQSAPDRIELHEELQAVVTVLRASLVPNTTEMEDMWHEARSVISAAHARSQAELRLAIERSYWKALESGERLSTSLDWSALGAALADELPQVLRSAFVSLRAADSPNELEPFFVLLDGEVCEPVRTRFAADWLVPPLTRLAEKRRTLYVLPLVSETDLLGIAVLEALPGSGTHEMLREQLEFAVKNVVLHRELLDKTALHERSVQERIATAKRMSALSVLAGGVAHDLNNALGSLVALPQVMLKQLPELGGGALSREFKEDLEAIQNSALRAAQTIKDLLALGRQGRTQREALDLNAIVQLTLSNEELYIEKAAQAGIELELELELDEPALPIQGSEAQISRAISNLLRNAVEAIRGQGVVRVRTRALTLEEPLLGYEAVGAGAYACVSVTDSGPGIDRADRNSIFEPFFSTKRLSAHSGSGLGLAIVHAVVKDHSGFVDVDSQPGAGATFTLYFPTAAERKRPKLDVPPPARGEGRVLIVDDDVIQLRTASRVLSHVGYDAVTIETGTGAYGLFAEASNDPKGHSPFDLVIIDMQLSNAEDGLAVFERIRALFPAQKGLVMSGHAPTERVVRAQNAGLAWLAKPYVPDDLLRAVQSALR
jgi:DNA-binding LacI/PurR family transcriptional regulator/signal transduction histidine kinase/ActR/RegA family two-component response regulator